MAYTTGFPTTYQPIQPIVYPQATLQQPVQPQIPAQQMQGNNSSITWVQGITGAKSYLVAPNTTVQLWDSEQQTIYLKSADASGMPSIRILDYSFREQEQPKSSIISDHSDHYATKDDIKVLQAKIDALKEKIETPGKAAGRKKAVTEDDE